MSFVIPRAELESIRRHLSETYPQEGCGLLVGSDRAGERRVAYAVPARNADSSPARRYVIDPEEFLAAELRARSAGFEVVGVYHSHPNRDPEPSPSDRDEAWPNLSYLIVSVLEGRAVGARCWRARAGQLAQEPMRIELGAGMEDRS